MQVRAAIRTINPREMKVLEVEPKLNRKVLVKNIRRVSSQIEAVYAAIQFVNGLFQWTNYLHSFVAFVVSILLVVTCTKSYLSIAVVCGAVLVWRLVDAVHDASVDICVSVCCCWLVYTTD